MRLGENKSKDALKKPDIRPFDITGKTMKGWVMVASDFYKDDRDIKAWLDQPKGFVKTLPKK